MTVWFDDEKKRWRFDFWRNKKRYHGYCYKPDGITPAETESEANDWETLKKAEAIRSPQVEANAPRGGAAYSLAQAITAYTAEACTQASWPSVMHYLEEFLQFFGAGMPLAEITRARMVEYRNWAKTQPILVYKGGPRRRDIAARRAGNRPLYAPRVDPDGKPVLRDEATVNRYMSRLRAVLYLAHRTPDPRDPERLRLLQVMPEVPFFDEPETVPRPFPLEAVRKLINDVPPHVMETMIACALTSWRQAAMLKARASDLDDEHQGIWYGADNKGNREGFTRLGPAGFAFFAALRERARKVGIDRFILYQERDGTWRPVKSFSSSWPKALARHGLKGKARFHQLKTLVLSQLHDAGVQPKLLQEIGQHKDFETTRRHYIATESRAAADAAIELERRYRKAGIDVAKLAARIARENATAAQDGNKLRTCRATGPTRESHTALEARVMKRAKSLR